MSGDWIFLILRRKEPSRYASHNAAIAGLRLKRRANGLDGHADNHQDLEAEQRDPDYVEHLFFVQMGVAGGEDCHAARVMDGKDKICRASEASRRNAHFFYGRQILVAGLRVC